jgi:hypothetical protein
VRVISSFASGSTIHAVDLDQVALDRPRPMLRAISDLNRERKTDLVVVDERDETLNVLLGNGDGTFTMSSTAPVPGTPPFRIATADFGHPNESALSQLQNPALFRTRCHFGSTGRCPYSWVRFPCVPEAGLSFRVSLRDRATLRIGESHKGRGELLRLSERALLRPASLGIPDHRGLTSPIVASAVSGM